MKHMWSEEEIQSFKKDISNLVDSKGNPRFVEGNGTPATITGFTSSYCKWSLSGTHLMLVLAGNFENAVSVSQGSVLATFAVPEFILNKIVPVIGSNIEYKQSAAYSADYDTQTINFLFRKLTNLIITCNSNITFTKARTFRIQFDLLIDAE